MTLKPLEVSFPLVVPLDIKLLEEIEKQSELVGKDLANLTQQLQSQVHQICGHTKESVNVHEEAIDRLCHTVDDSVVQTSRLVQQIDEISRGMPSLDRLAAQIKSINSSLDGIEQLVLKRKS